MMYLLLLFLLAGCGVASPWHCDTISAASHQFDSSRLTYKTPSSHLGLELLKAGDKIYAFLFLDQHRFSTDNAPVKIFLTIGDEQLTEILPVRKGGMKILLSNEMSEKLILGLQEGKSAVILGGGFQETIDPADFEPAYSKFMKGESLFSNLLKDPLE